MKQVILFCFLSVISVAAYSKEVNPFERLQREFEDGQFKKFEFELRD